MVGGRATPRWRLSLFGKMVLAIPLNLLLAVLVFGATPATIAGGILCGAAGAWMAYLFQTVFDPPGRCVRPAPAPKLRPDQAAAFRHRHA